MNVNDFLASAELPLVAMIKVVAASMMTTLKIRNLTLFDAARRRRRAGLVNPISSPSWNKGCSSTTAATPAAGFHRPFALRGVLRWP